VADRNACAMLEVPVRSGASVAVTIRLVQAWK
jgi:hypothetical protein